MTLKPMLWMMKPIFQVQLPPKPETIITMPFPANKDIEYSPHELAMKDTMVHIEYPDRTKFVSSMNHEQYEEMKTYNDLV
jgi:hypothetical protein